MQWLAGVPFIVLLAAAPAPKGLDDYVAHHDANYSDEHRMLASVWFGPGYHTKIPDGTRVHTTRGSLEYALALLARGGQRDVARAEAIIGKVISLQDQRPQSRSRGIWPWLLEEPIDQMAAPDYNWADFCGALLAQMLHSYNDRLSPSAREQMRESLRLAAEAIKRRNVGPDYTNIALMGGGVCAAAGELLHDAALLEYGRSRLQRLVEHTKLHGSFNEFNSPTYTMVALREAERTLYLVRDEQARAAAEWLRRRAWQTVAESFHPATSQWCGPHSRAYSDYIDRWTAQYLSDATGVSIAPHPKAAGRRAVAEPNYFGLPCPDEFRPYFQRLTASPHDIPKAPPFNDTGRNTEQPNRDAANADAAGAQPAKRMVLNKVERRWTFIKRGDEASSIIGTAWLGDDACFGTVNSSTFWTQARPILAYWRTADDPAVVFRVRFFHNGRDFASMGCATAQQRNRALVVISPRLNHGSWHLNLDRPRDGIFRATDFRLVCQLRGSGVAASRNGDNRFELSSGEQRMVIHPAPTRAGDQPVVWRSQEGDETAQWSAVFYEGDEKAFDWRSPPPLVLAFGVELLREDEQPAASSPRWNELLSQVSWTPATGSELTVAAPAAVKR